MYQDQLKYFNNKSNQVLQPGYVESQHCQSRNEPENAGDNSETQKSITEESSPRMPEEPSPQPNLDSQTNLPFNSPMKIKTRTAMPPTTAVNNGLPGIPHDSPKLRYIEEQLNSMASFIGESGASNTQKRAEPKRRSKSVFVNEKRGSTYNNCAMVTSGIPSLPPITPVCQAELVSGIQEYTRKATRGPVS